LATGVRRRVVPAARPWCPSTPVDRQPLGVDQFGFEVVQIVVVEAKPTLQGSVGDAALLLQQRQDLREYVIKRHLFTLPLPMYLDRRLFYSLAPLWRRESHCSVQFLPP
jgi:hypothetical protein